MQNPKKNLIQMLHLMLKNEKQKMKKKKEVYKIKITIKKNNGRKKNNN